MRGRITVVLLCLSIAPVLPATPHDPASLRNRAAALLDNGDDDRAIEIFRDLAKRLPESSADQVNLGIALLHHNDLDGAASALAKGLALDPRDPRARYNLGLVLKRQGKNEEATAQLARVAASPEGSKDATDASPGQSQRVPRRAATLSNSSQPRLDKATRTPILARVKPGHDFFTRFPPCARHAPRCGAHAPSARKFVSSA